MATFDEVQRALQAWRLRITDHGDDAMSDEELSPRGIVECTLAPAAEVIEDYPQAYPHPACLVLTRLPRSEPLHLVWAFESPSGYAVLVTLYRPDPARWSADVRKRVKR